MMKFNNKELADLSFGEATIEGRLHHRKISGGYSHSGKMLFSFKVRERKQYDRFDTMRTVLALTQIFKERWFKLRANILFYFNLSETGQIFDKKPVGAFILENVIIQYEMNSEVPFSFSIYFNDEIEKKHLFSGRSQENINKWVSALKQASYEYWRSQLMLLQEKIKMITGQDPLLMYPRNAGCRHVFSEENELSYQFDNKTQVQNSTFHSFIANEDNVEDNLKKGKKSSTAGISNQLVGLASNSPPVRPARGNKLKQEVQCENLIDL